MAVQSPTSTSFWIHTAQVQWLRPVPHKHTVYTTLKVCRTRGPWEVRLQTATKELCLSVASTVMLNYVTMTTYRYSIITVLGCGGIGPRMTHVQALWCGEARCRHQRSIVAPFSRFIPCSAARGRHVISLMILHFNTLCSVRLLRKA